MKELRAYAVSCKPVGSVGIYGAPTPGVARMRSLGGALMAGYRVTYTDFQAKRAPAFDALIAKHGMVCWSSEYADTMLAAAPRSQQAGDQAVASQTKGAQE